MKKSPHRFPIAIFFIAVCAVSTGAWSQKVYRCGASYSQTPCPDAVALDADDARSTAQKTQTDQATARDVKTAHTLEQARLKDENAAAQRPPVTQDGTSRTAKTKSNTLVPKKVRKKKEPAFFTAQAAPEKKTAPSKAGN